MAWAHVPAESGPGNVCERPFKEEFKPRSRREALLEYTGEELPKLIQKGNLLAMLARTCRMGGFK